MMKAKKIRPVHRQHRSSTVGRVAVDRSRSSSRSEAVTVEIAPTAEELADTVEMEVPPELLEKARPPARARREVEAGPGGKEPEAPWPDAPSGATAVPKGRIRRLLDEIEPALRALALRSH